MAFLQSELRIRLSNYSKRAGLRGFHSRVHEHPFYELGFVASGTCLWTLGNGRRFRLKLGEILLLPPATKHREDVDGDAERKISWVGFESPEEMDLKAISLRKLDLSADCEKVNQLMRWIESDWHGDERHGSAEVATKALEMLLLLILRRRNSVAIKPEPHPLLNERQCRLVRSATAYFEENLSLPRSVEQIARYHFLSVSHFSSIFRIYHGQSPTEYVQKLRLRRTIELLRKSDITIKEIASQCGYVDAAHFCKHFKRETGCSPTEFRTSGG